MSPRAPGPPGPRAKGLRPRRRLLPVGLRLALLLVLLLPLARAAEVVPVEETETYETRGELAPGESRLFRFRVLREDATRVSFHLLRAQTPDAATLRLDAWTPEGTPAAAPVASREAFLALDARPERPAGEWRVALALDEAARAPVAFVLVVLVARERPVTLHEVTLRGAPVGFPTAAGAVLVGALLLAGAAHAARKARSGVPPGGQHGVPDAGTARVCAAPVTERP